MSTSDEASDFVSRPYQDVILQSCIDRNTIIYLPTGAGKTYIAIMAIKHFSPDLQRSINEGGKRTVFLTKTQQLAYQQKQVIEKLTPFKVELYTGVDNVDEWSKEKWFQEFEKNQVIVATAEIILNVVVHGFLKLSHFNVIVFDECHNARKKDPMLLLMEKFKEVQTSEHPRVIGLTGMLTAPSIKLNEVKSDLKRLEATFRAVIMTAKGDTFGDVLMHSTCPVEKVICYDEPASCDDTITERLEKMKLMIDDWELKTPKIKPKFKKICDFYENQFNTLGLYGGIIANLAAIADLELLKRESNSSAAKFVSRALITEFERILHENSQKMFGVMGDEDETLHNDLNMILTHSSNYVQQLLICLKTFIDTMIQNKVQMKGLIFVEQRQTARILSHVIRRFGNACPDLNIQVDFITGENDKRPESVEALMSIKNNKQVLDKFKRGEINLIVATSVLEEGIDVQECNLVVSFDTPITFRSYVQSKGRARMKNSEYKIMVPTNKITDFESKLSEWTKIIAILKEELVERTVDRSEPSLEDIEKAVELKFNETLKTKFGAIADFYSSISLVNRYCGALPKDQFTTPIPQWKANSINDQIVVSILLPTQSPLIKQADKISGKPMPTLKMAKRSAAFETIKMLYSCNELDDWLMPIQPQNCFDRCKDLFFGSWTEYENEDKEGDESPGTKKKHRMHEIQVPDALRDSMPQINKQCYLYEFKIEPAFDVSNSSDENVKVFHQLLKLPATYGILTRKPLPRMGLMKFYQSFGQINCSVSHQAKPIILQNIAELNMLKRFHCVLFRNVLNIWKDFFVYDQRDSVIVVPFKNRDIDWAIVKNFQIWSEVQQKSVLDRTTAHYIEKEWLNKVVCPWYRSSENTRYVVTHVATWKTPLSPFPSEEYKNYSEYITKTYSNVSKIVNDNQFLIGVKPVTTHLNRLHPGDGEDGCRTVKERETEYLIPELCHNFQYPGDLWLKAIILPSALHRITYILHAERLRNLINNYVELEINDYKPRPLTGIMARKQANEFKMEGTVSIRRRIEKAQAQELKITPFDMEFPTSSMHEPMDLERNFDVMRPCDIDYLFSYINSTKFGPSSKQSNIGLNPIAYKGNAHINLLNIKLSTNIPRGVEQHELLAAITAASSADVFHNEVLEVLGDAFLKFGVSLYLIQRYTDWHEGYLTPIKGRIVSNRNLFYCVANNKVPGMIKIHNFNPKNDWQPPMLKVADCIQRRMKQLNVTPDELFHLKLSENEREIGQPFERNYADYERRIANVDDSGEDSLMQSFLGMQRVSDKTCADCVEAILGSCVKSIGIERTFKVLQLFDILPCNEIDIKRMLQHKLRSPRIRTNIPDNQFDYFLPNYKQLETTIGYEFKDRAYLLQALTHPTYPTNRVTGCYQQLEFLGDAVLDFLITAYISEQCPNMNPGQLTDLRSALVNNVTLACLCVRYKMHAHILYQNARLAEIIGRFVDLQERYSYEVTDHVELLMEEEQMKYKMAEYMHVPKTLGDVFEAIIGGIFLDSGNNLEVTWNVVYRLMQNELKKFIANVPIQLVRQLYEYPNANPEFVELKPQSDSVKIICLHFTSQGKRMKVFGYGDNKKNAKRAAAKLALLSLKKS